MGWCFLRFVHLRFCTLAPLAPAIETNRGLTTFTA